ncbi:MAG: SelB C-terminal domain-containing protein, partial [Actinomycetota bacterium]|nr:SelB C-terminal domain-containing protein [Actinomycetota bacterium]
AAFRSGARAPAEGVVALGSWLVTEDRRDELARAVLDELRGYHAGHPLERGMPREMLKPAVRLRADAFDALLDAIDPVVQEGALVRLETHAVALEPAQQAARARVLAEIEAAGFTPPLAKDLAADASLLRALVENGDLVSVGDFYITSAQAAAAKEKVKARIEESGGATVAEIRDLLGTTRKYAVPLCEWLDAEGTTRRRGDLRVLGPRV